MNPTDIHQEFPLSVEAVAAATGVHQATIYGLHTRGIIPPSMWTVHNRKRVYKQEIVPYLQHNYYKGAHKQPIPSQFFMKKQEDEIDAALADLVRDGMLEEFKPEVKKIPLGASYKVSKMDLLAKELGIEIPRDQFGSKAPFRVCRPLFDAAIEQRDGEEYPLKRKHLAAATNLSEGGLNHILKVVSMPDGMRKDYIISNLGTRFTLDAVAWVLAQRRGSGNWRNRGAGEVLKVDTGVPVPENHGEVWRKSLQRATSLEATLRGMAPGQSTFLPGKSVHNMGTPMRRASKQTGHTYTSRTRQENGVMGVRIWRVE